LLTEHHDPSIVQLTGNKPESFQVNLADDPNYKDKLEEMEKLLLEQQFKYNDPLLLWDYEDILIKMNLKN
jgi:hypothetical protein